LSYNIIVPNVPIAPNVSNVFRVGTLGTNGILGIWNPSIKTQCKNSVIENEFLEILNVLFGQNIFKVSSITFVAEKKIDSYYKLSRMTFFVFIMLQVFLEHF
jgi:hypothetical protein